MGLLRPQRQPRRPRLLRPTSRGRRHPPPSPACTRQPTRRDPPRLPPPPHRLQRRHRLGTPPNHSRRPSRLTIYEPGLSSQIVVPKFGSREPNRPDTKATGLWTLYWARPQPEYHYRPDLIVRLPGPG